MKTSAIIQIIVLCIFSCIQSMEVTQPLLRSRPLILSLSKDEGQATTINLPIFTFNNALIKQLKTSSKQNTSDPNLFQRRAIRLHLLERLLDQKAEISFSNNNPTTLFWHNKNDTKMIQDILYEKLLSFISYNNSQHKIHIQHTSFSKEQSFNAVLQFNCSVLNIIIQSLTNELRNIASKFLEQYNPNPSKNIYDFWGKDYQQQMIVQPDDKITFEMLPQSTQWVLQEIFDDMDNKKLLF